MKTRNVLISGIVVLAFLFATDVKAQHGLAEFGVRVGGTSGVTAKYFYSNSMALEGIVGTFHNGWSLTGLIEKYHPVFNASGFYVYYGAGAHVAFYGNNRYVGPFGRDVNYANTDNVGFGINGIIGLEYRMPENIPIAFTMDLKPFAEVVSGGYVAVAPDPSIGIKFLIR